MDDHPRTRAGWAVRVLPAVVLIGYAAGAGATAVGSGRHWQMTIEELQCDIADSVVTMDTRIRYLGGAGLVEAPVLRIAGGEGRTVPPRSLVWKDGSKPLAALISAGGIRRIEPNTEGRMQFKFPLRDVAGNLRLEFGDLKAIALAKAAPSGARGVCERLLKAGQVQAAQPARPPLGNGAVPRMRVYRDAYPCRESARGTARTIEAPHPPYAPEQVLVLGHGYLPNLREVDLPTGRAAAQSYAYAGRDELEAIEDSARRAVAADFPSYAVSAKHFAFNWGIQRSASGNELYSVGLYRLRPCAK